jgi:hypothetical protein
VPIAERRTARLERLPVQRRRLNELALNMQQPPQMIDGVESRAVPVAERRTARLERLPEQRRRLIELALSLDKQQLS